MIKYVNAYTGYTAYQALVAHTDRQSNILDRVISQQDEVLLECEKMFDSIVDVMRSTYPSLDDLPLDLMTEASRQADGKDGQDFSDLLKTLKAEQESSLAEINAYEARHGLLSTLYAERDKLECDIERSERNIDRIDRNITFQERLKYLFDYKLTPLMEFELETGIALTNASVKSYEEMNFLRYITDKEYRGAKRAIAEFRRIGGLDIDKFRNDIDALRNVKAETEQREVEAGKERSAAFAILKGQKSDLQEISEHISGLRALERKYKNDSGIHDEICTVFAEYLRHDSVAVFVGKKLPPAQAEPLLETALKLIQLTVIHNSLEQIGETTKNRLSRLLELTQDVAVIWAPVVVEPDAINKDFEAASKEAEAANKESEAALDNLALSREKIGTFSTGTINADRRRADEGYANDPFTFFQMVMLASIVSNSPAVSAEIPRSEDAPNIDVTSSFSSSNGSGGRGVCDITDDCRINAGLDEQKPRRGLKRTMEPQ